jgi:hypothetical protein
MLKWRISIIQFSIFAFSNCIRTHSSIAKITHDAKRLPTP